MSTKQILGFDQRNGTGFWSKDVPDFEGRINEVTLDSDPLTQVYRLNDVTELGFGEFWFDKINKVLHVRLLPIININEHIVIAKIYFTFFGQWDTKANVANGSLNQVFTCNQNALLRYVRIPIMLMGSGTITGLQMEIRAVRNGIITEKVLATSDNMDAVNNLSTKQNNLIFTYFKFTEYGLKAGVDYALVLKFTTPTEFTDSFHLAWSSLDPVYLTGLPTDETIIQLGGYSFALIGVKI